MRGGMPNGGSTGGLGDSGAEGANPEAGRANSEGGDAKGGERPQRPRVEGERPDGAQAPSEFALPGAPRFGSSEPIKTLAEASSLRQAIALYVNRMDFNGDGTLQKTEFIKGYHEVNDTAQNLFASTTLINAVDTNRGGFPGPPPR